MYTGEVIRTPVDPARRNDAAHPEGGMTLVEMMVALFLLTLVVTSLSLVITNGIRTQTVTERADRATGLTQVIMSKARQAAFGELGFYDQDTTAPVGNVNLPISPVTTGGTGPSITEEAVQLGPRPPGKSTFTPPVDEFTDDGIDYRVTTYVTWVPNADGSTPTAKRVTVVTQWAPAPADLTGDCTDQDTRCATQSLVRTAAASDIDPVTGQSPESSCDPSTATICSAYARAGRVLDGATMASVSDAPQQVAPVDLFVHTSSTATSVNAQWTWLNAAGTPVKVVNVPLSPGGDGTRWTAQVDPDTQDGSSTHKGDIRPGANTVTFTATMDGGTDTVNRPVFWSYGLGADANTVSASIVDATTWCSPVGSATPVRFKVSGHSIGFTPTTQNAGAQDRVDVVFTSTTAGTTRTETVTATVDPTTVVQHEDIAHDIVIGGWAEAVWEVNPPSTEHCDNRAVSVLLHRAADQTTTPVVLQLPAATPVAPALDTPDITAELDTDGQVTVTWTTPPSTAEFVVAHQVDGGPWAEQSTVDTTTTFTLDEGQALTVRVKALNGWSSSGWSDEVTVTNNPGAPVVAAARSGRAAIFTWPAAPGATGYVVEHSIDGGTPVETTPTGRTFTIDLERGQTVDVNVYSTSGGTRSTTPGTASITMPLWDPLTLQSGWTNYGVGYSPAQYTRSTDGVVVLTGLIRYGATDNDTLLGTLPVGYRPDSTLIFRSAEGGGDVARVDVYTDGRVVLTRAPTTASSWVSLSGITFLAADAPVTRTPVDLLAGWTNYGGSYADLTSALDGSGRVHLQGLIRPGTTTAGTFIGWLPTAHRSDEHLYFSSLSANAFNEVVLSDTIRTTSITGPGWLSIQAMYYGTGQGTWTAPTLQSGWQRYSTTFPTLQYSKGADGIVTLRGLVKGGSTTNETVVANLPPGYRPAGRQITPIVSNHAHGRVDVTASGDIVVRAPIHSAWVSVDGISFMAEQ